MTVRRRASPFRLLLIWAAVLACLALIVAALSVWAWWSFVGQYRPMTVTRDADRIERMLAGAPWLSDGSGEQALYMVGYRDSAALRRFQAEQADALQARGVQLRVLMFARPDRDGVVRSTEAERATAAELWLSRDPDLYLRWLETPARNWTAAGIPGPESDPVRAGALAEGRRLAQMLEQRLALSRVPAQYPLLVWRDADGALKACACSDPTAWPRVIADLPASEPAPAVAPGPPPPSAAASAKSSALPYPILPPPSAPELDVPELDVPGPDVAGPDVPEPDAPEPDRPVARPASPEPRVLPPVRREVAPSQRQRADPPRAQPEPRRRRAEPARPRHRRAPEAKRDEDSTFF